MDEPDDRFERVCALVAAESAGAGPHGGLDRLCRAAARALSVSGVGLSVIVEASTRGAVVASDAASARVEELQFTVGQGPCLEAVASGRPVFVPDLTTAAARWPAYVSSAYEQGVRAVFAFPLQIGAMRLGALDVYCSRAGPLDFPILQDAAVFAEVALLTLLDAQARAPDGEAATVLEVGLRERSTVYQAQGMVKVQLGISLAEAMTRLRAFAYAHDHPLSEVARAVVDRRLTLGDRPDDNDDDDRSGGMTR